MACSLPGGRSIHSSLVCRRCLADRTPSQPCLFRLFCQGPFFLGLSHLLLVSSTKRVTATGSSFAPIITLLFKLEAQSDGLGSIGIGTTGICGI